MENAINEQQLWANVSANNAALLSYRFGTV